MAREARRWDVDGVVCGHVRTAVLRTISDVLYTNAGSWVEHCTALVEHLSGQLQIIHGKAAAQRPVRRRAAGADRAAPDRSSGAAPADGRAQPSSA